MELISKNFKETLLLNTFGLLKIPMIAFLWPRVVRIDDEVCEIKIPLSYRSKNHLGAMYFGALSVGADMSGGLIAMREIQKSKKKISLVFKNFHANFLKRAEADVHFYSKDVQICKNLVQKCIESKEREETILNVYAKCPKLSEDIIAQFQLTLSLKCKN